MLNKYLLLIALLCMLPSCVATAIMGGAAAGSAAFDERPVKQQASDASISSQVQAKLIDEKDMPSRYVSIDVIEGEVTLTGFLPSKQHIRRAETIASSVKGVRSVRNELRVGKPSAGNWMSDSWITTQVKAKLFDDGIKSGVNVRVETVDGVVYLQGIVASEDMRYRAAGLARAIDGVVEVKNLLKVRSR